jgi:hypothetical protein
MGGRRENVGFVSGLWVSFFLKAIPPDFRGDSLFKADIYFEDDIRFQDDIIF